MSTTESPAKPEWADYVKVGSVVQIMPEHDPGDGSRRGLVGAFVYVTEPKSWGVQGFVHHVDTFATHKSIYLRLRWSEIELIGQSPLKLSDEPEEK